MAKKIITASINLPVETVKTIIDVDDRDVEISINEAISKFEVNQNVDNFTVRSMNTIVNSSTPVDNQKYVPAEYVNVLHDFYNINNITKKPIEKTNEIKFFKINLDFSNGVKREFIVPSFVKFYSSRTASFVTVERLRSRHILVDYKGNDVKTSDAEPIEDFVMGNYYNIKVSYDLDEEYVEKNGDKERAKPCTYNFYLNGVLTNVSYNNFQIKDTNED